MDPHDVCFVDGSDALAAACLGMVEGIPGNALGSIPSDQLDRLDDTINNLNVRKSSEAFSRAHAGKPTSCSMPEYSPSVFSRMRTVLTSSYAVLNPLIEAQGRTLAKRLKVRRRVRLRETCPLPTVIDGQWDDRVEKAEKRTGGGKRA